jgi:DNA-binding MarR family transcriptional regulator
VSTAAGSPRFEAPPLPPLGEPLEFLRLLWAIEHGLQRRSKRMAAVLGVTGPQRLVLRIVGRFPGISPGQLAGILHVHPSTLTGILRRLERRGLLTRRTDPLDKRRVALGLSAAGRRLDLAASGTIEAEMKGLLATVPKQDTLAARRVLLALTRQLQTPSASFRSPRTPPR